MVAGAGAAPDPPVLRLGYCALFVLVVVVAPQEVGVCLACLSDEAR